MGEDLLLERILRGIGPCLVAFSGGVDSTYLLKVAHDFMGDETLAVTAVSPSLSAAEREDAVRLARFIGASHLLVETHEMDEPAYVRNDARRCYYCKAELFRVLDRVAAGNGGKSVIYGAIPDDLGDDRPGMAAAAAFRVRAPLIEAGVTKSVIRERSRLLGLPTWDKPAMACLASRIARFTPVTAGAMAQVERAEAAIRSMGYKQVRVRSQGDEGRIELDREGLERASIPGAQRSLEDAVRSAGFRLVTIDPGGYRPGGRRAPRSGA